MSKRSNYDDVLARTTQAVEEKSIIPSTYLHIGQKYTGKVRDVYTVGNYTVIITTDRLSAFDRLLACVPFKGSVLNLTSVWWFNNTKHIIPNHIVHVPHPNVTIVKRCNTFKVEFVVRAYLTGSTGTSIWVHYNAGSRNYCGHKLPEGMKKNQILPYVMVTPTTKDDAHDRPITPEEIVEQNLMTQEEWDYVSSKALEIFKFGQKEAASRGLILVDTKYEFGRDALTNEITLIDEIHTPDSSRYWIQSTYEQRLAEGKEPENIDKEFLRIWFRNHCDPYADSVLPDAPKELVAELSKRYIQLYETITGEEFTFPSSTVTSGQLIDNVRLSVEKYFTPSKNLLCYCFIDTSGDTDNLSPNIHKNTGFLLDTELNGHHYKENKQQFPIKTNVAIEIYPLDILNNTVTAASTCKHIKSSTNGSSSSGPSTSLAVVACTGSNNTGAEFVRRHSGIPTIALVSNIQNNDKSYPVLTTDNIDSVVSFVSAFGK